MPPTQQNHPQSTSPTAPHGPTRRSAAVISVRVGALSAWMLAIFLFSAQPGTESAASSDFIAALVHKLGVAEPSDDLTFLIRKSGHAIAYFVLGMLSVWALCLTKLSQLMMTASGIAFVLLYAVSDEVHQLFVPGRSGELRDVMLDTIAGALGVVVALMIHRLCNASRTTSTPRPS